MIYNGYIVRQAKHIGDKMKYNLPFNVTLEISEVEKFWDFGARVKLEYTLTKGDDVTISGVATTFGNATDLQKVALCLSGALIDFNNYPEDGEFFDGYSQATMEFLKSPEKDGLDSIWYDIEDGDFDEFYSLKQVDENEYTIDWLDI